MTQTAYTIDSANDTGQIDIFVDMFVSSFAYSAGEFVLSEITEKVDLTREQMYYNLDKIEEWLALIKVNMPAVEHPQPVYLYEIEHESGKVKFKFEHDEVLTLELEYKIPEKLGCLEPRVEQTLTLRAFSRYVETLRLLIENVQLYKD